MSSAAGRVQIHLDSSYGNYIDIYHGDGYVTRYAHLSAFSVENNEWVHQGQEVGKVGNTGYHESSCTGEHAGSHLHFVIYHNGNAYKPESIGMYNKFNKNNWYTSTNDAYGELNYWDQLCKSILPDYRVERFRNPGTEKIEV